MNKYHIPKRDYFRRALLSLLFTFSYFFIYIAIFFKKDSDGEILDIQPYLTEVLLIVSTILLLLTFLILSWLIMRKTLFYDNEKEFIVEKGLIFKRKTIIPYFKINTVSLKRNILSYILKTTKIELDTESAVNNFPEVTLILKKDYALVLKEYLESKKSDETLILPCPYEKVKIEKKDDLLIYGSKPLKLFLFGLLRPGFLASLVATIIISVPISNITDIDGNKIHENPVIAFLLFLIIPTIMLTLAFGLASLIKYFNYKVKLIDNKLEYEYGLLSRTNFKININKINALYIKQSLLFKLFKKYSLEVSVIGVEETSSDNKKKESSYLLHMVDKEKLDEIINLINFKKFSDDHYIIPNKFRKLNLIFIPLIFISPLLIIPAVLILIYVKEFSLTAVSLILIYLLSIVALMLRVKYHGYKTSKKSVIIKKGMYTTKTTLIKKEVIQSITYNRGIIKQILNIGIITISYKKFLGKAHINCYTKDIFNKLKDELL